MLSILFVLTSLNATMINNKQLEKQIVQVFHDLQ